MAPSFIFPRGESLFRPPILKFCPSGVLPPVCCLPYPSRVPPAPREPVRKRGSETKPPHFPRKSHVKKYKNANVENGRCGTVPEMHAFRERCHNGRFPRISPYFFSMASSRKAGDGECFSMNGEEMLFCCRKDSTSSAQGREVTNKDSRK